MYNKNYDKIRMLRFGDLGDERGSLIVVEGGEDVPFEIRRVFYIYGSDATIVRGQHANRRSEFVLINVAAWAGNRSTAWTPPTPAFTSPAWCGRICTIFRPTACCWCWPASITTGANICGIMRSSRLP